MRIVRTVTEVDVPDDMDPGEVLTIFENPTSAPSEPALDDEDDADDEDGEDEDGEDGDDEDGEEPTSASE